MGFKRRQRGVEMWASRDGDYMANRIRLWRHRPYPAWSPHWHLNLYEDKTRFFVAEFGESAWPGPELKPGEVRKVRVTIEEVGGRC